jgi:Subtilase family
VSHRSLRSPLVPFTAGLAAAIAVLAVAGSGPAFGVGSGTGAAAAGPVRAQEWWLAGLNVTQAWRQAQGAGVTVAVLGTGVAASHPDLAGDVLTGPDYSGSGRPPGGPFWGIDGTQVAAIIAGHGHGAGRQSGIIGVAPAAKILSIRVNLEFNDPLNSDQALTRRLPGAIADGITYAVNHGARVIDLPLDPGTFGLTGHGDPAAAGGSPAEQAAVSYALRKSVVLVAPAGDDGQGPGLVNYPAAYAGVIAVGAVSRDGHLAPFSSRRSYVSLTAPGFNLVAAIPPASYATVSSTIAASGIVAGLAALLLSRFPQLTVAQVTQALTGSTATTAVTDGAAGPGTGYGTVDAARAVSLAADIITAARPARAATPPAKPPKPPRRVSAAPRRADASVLAHSLVRDIVAALAGLIVLVIVLLLIMSSRRKRALARSGPGRTRSLPGQHGRRRPDQAPAPGPAAAGPSRPQLARPAGRWPAPGGWQGGSVGEIAHPAAPPIRPAIAPVPRTGPTSRTGSGARTPAKSAGPPWSPASEPGRTISPLPVTSATSFAPEPGPGIRVPRDMTALRSALTVPTPGAVGPSPWTAAAEPPPRTAAAEPLAPPPVVDSTSGPQAPAFPPPDPAFPPPDPAFPPPGSYPDTIPDFRRLGAGRDTTGSAAGPDAVGLDTPGPDITDPDITDLDITRPISLPELPSRESLGFAAAPVATGYPALDRPASYRALDTPASYLAPAGPAGPAGYSAPAGPADYPTPAGPGGDAMTPGPGAAAGSSYIWDLTATDVFPVTPAEPPDTPDDDAPGASGS